jgi:hypothetical protein
MFRNLTIVKVNKSRAAHKTRRKASSIMNHDGMGIAQRKVVDVRMFCTAIKRSTPVIYISEWLARRV